MTALTPTTQALVILLVALPLIAFWFLMLRDMVGRHDLPPQTRNFWLVLLVFFNVFGAALYYFNEYRGRRR